MSGRIWCYPAIVAAMGSGTRPDRAALRALVKRLYAEAFPPRGSARERRARVRRSVVAIFRGCR